MKPIVGRAVELAAVETLLDGARHGAAALVLDGEAGIGKTAIWLAGVEQAREGGYRVLRCRPAEVEAELPFVSLGDLLEPILDEGLETLAASYRLALETALGRIPPTEATDPRAVARATAALLRGAAPPRHR